MIRYTENRLLIFDVIVTATYTEGLMIAWWDKVKKYARVVTTACGAESQYRLEIIPIVVGNVGYWYP